MYITSLSLDLMTEQISELLKKNDGKKETTGRFSFIIIMIIIFIHSKYSAKNETRNSLPIRFNLGKNRLSFLFPNQPTDQLAIRLLIRRLPIP